MKFISWNINGANSVFNGGGLEAALKFFEADVLAFYCGGVHMLSKPSVFDALTRN